MPSPIPPTVRAPAGRLGMTVAIVLVALNARPSLTSLGPVLPEALAATGLGHEGAGLVTTLPVLLLGVFGLFAPILSRRFGAERAILGLILLLAAGIGLRALGSATALVVGCALGGGAIGAINVLAPGLVKRDFADRTAPMMGLYTMALAIGAAVAAGATAPLATALGGWAAGLAVWALPALVAAAFWAALPAVPGSSAEAAAPPAPSLWRNALAWQVTLFMGLQSALAYALFAWAPAMLRDRGFDPVAAGLIVSVSILVQIPAALGAPILATRGKDQRAAVAVTTALSVGGLAGLLFAPVGQVWIWAVVLGLGQGGVFAVAMTVMLLRAGDAREAAALSAMSQGIGYALAALAPLLAGLLRDLTGGWTVPVLVLLAIGLAAGAFGLMAGRDRKLSRSAPSAA